MSVAMSVKLGTSMAVDFDDRSREIQDTAAAMLELADTAATAGARSLRNPSHVNCHLSTDSSKHVAIAYRWSGYHQSASV